MNVSNKPLQQRIFIFNNKAYKNGTEVKFKKEFADSFVYDSSYFGPEYKLWRYAKFYHRFPRNGKVWYNFGVSRLDAEDGGVKYPNKPYNIFLIEDSQLEDAIEEIITPVEVEGEYEIVPIRPKKDVESEDVMMGWVCFIAFLLFSFVFVQWPVAWILGGAGFYLWRKRELSKW